MSIILYKAQNMVDNATTNGGYMSNDISIDNIRNNIFPNISESQRTSGLTTYRKLFWKHEHSQDAPLNNTRIFLDSTTYGQDYVTLIPGTQTDVQNALTGAEQQYGIGKINANISAGTTSFACTVENSNINVFFNTGTIRLANATSEEFFTNVTVSKNMAVYTITLDTGDVVANNYLASDTYVSSVIEAGVLSVYCDTFTANTVSGTYSNSLTPIILSTFGTIHQQWTITFTSSTTFTCAGNTLGNIGNIGNVGSSFSITNSAMNSPYLTIPANFFTGTWASGQWLKFYTHPSSYAVWFKRVVPAGAESCSNYFTHGITGESA